MTSERSPLWRRLLRSPAFVTGTALLALSLVMILMSATFYRGNPLSVDSPPFIEPVTEAAHPLGTDMLGRDMLAQMVHGARVSLLTGVVAAAVAVLLGALLGVLGGYFGGWVDRACTRITEVFQTLPQLLLAIVLVAVLTPSLWSTMLAIGLTSWPQVARVVRPEVMRLRQTDFVHAAALSGMPPLRIIWHEVLPNVVPTVVALASVLVATAILTESALAFLGLGDPNLASWGAMIGAGRSVLRDAWYVAAFPGFAILATVLAFALIGNGINDALHLRRR
ncbi:MULTISPECIES: ABC transporter permease [unclassified Variovorax]|uniref:ABC transporter permease n=1 Tax=unclassified Variovorax TaxID=663243 RepID=UPI0025789AD7|nr:MULTISPECIES: ABC transporter permease [unclassified Variovorax]MDM0086687.1 ABC transporter permease [Variovorax sp. J22G40]MDM0145057.1 ABC transporter permease [Variovorax sp. J2P1-31]